METKNHKNNNNSKVKRDRSKNFLPIEREQLLQICTDFIEVIENKKTDSVSCKKKYEAWVEIAKQFNAIQTTGPRNDKHLKTLYDNIKRDAKRHKNGEKLNPCGQFVGHVTSLCNVLITETDNHFELSENKDEESRFLNGSSNHLNTSSDSIQEILSIKEEPQEPDIEEISEPESESVLPFNNSLSSKESSTSDANNSSQADNLLKRRNIAEVCNTSTSISTDVVSDEYNKTRLMYLAIEHKKKMEILNLEQECLLLKRDLLKAKLEAVTAKNEKKNLTNV